MAMTAEIQITASKTEYKEGDSGTLSIIEWTPIDATNEESISVGSAVPSNKLSKWTLSGDGSISGSGSTVTEV